MLVKKEDLRKANKELVSQIKRLQFQVSTYKQISDYYSSPREHHDHGAFAREVIEDMSLRLKKKTYKPVNYSLSRILKESDKSFPIYIEGLFDEYEDYKD